MEEPISYAMNWFTADEIGEDHRHLPVTQVYVWIGTADHKLVLVSAKPGRWQFPGGHPEKGETLLETAIREVFEETGLDISREKGNLRFFGYYLVEEKQGGKVIKRYLQVRYFLLLREMSEKVKVFVNERENEERKVNNVGVFSLAKAYQLIPWLSTAQELAVFKEKVGW